MAVTVGYIFLKDSAVAYMLGEKTPKENLPMASAAATSRRSKVLVLLRGCPGSGKSTLARQLCTSDKGVILSADDYFMRDGTYNYDRTKINQAHTWNQKRAAQSIKEGKNPVIIDNTNVSLWEMVPYAEMAVRCGYRVEIREPNTPWKYDAKELSKRNTHGVPLETIARMLSKYNRQLSLQDLINCLPVELRQSYSNRRRSSTAQEASVIPQPQTTDDDDEDDIKELCNRLKAMPPAVHAQVSRVRSGGGGGGGGSSVRSAAPLAVPNRLLTVKIPSPLTSPVKTSPEAKTPTGKKSPKRKSSTGKGPSPKETPTSPPFSPGGFMFF